MVIDSIGSIGGTTNISSDNHFNEDEIYFKIDYAEIAFLLAQIVEV